MGSKLAERLKGLGKYNITTQVTKGASGQDSSLHVTVQIERFKPSEIVGKELISGFSLGKVAVIGEGKTVEKAQSIALDKAMELFGV